MWLAMIVLGVLFMILMMALFFNPPEALVKKMFVRQGKTATKGSKDPEQRSR